VKVITAHRASVPWLVLVSRLALFALAQALIAVALSLLGSTDAWNESGRWWIFSAIATNTVSILILIRALRAEGKRFQDIVPFIRRSFRADLFLSIGVFILAAPIGTIPGNVLGEFLFGDPAVPVAMMFRPLPLWAVLIGILFPLTIALSELPTYFGYAMPRLEQNFGNGWPALALAALFLSLQHLTLPLILDWRFIAWRSLMFLPFALYLGIVLKLRPRLLPYLMVSHFLIDMLALSTYFMR
jgi:membrane protease YdiL (CAAX protease family)